MNKLRDAIFGFAVGDALGVPYEFMKRGTFTCTDIEEQAQDHFERIVEQMKQTQKITEQLKVDNTWEWVGRMNNIQACAREIVDKEIIYQ